MKVGDTHTGKLRTVPGHQYFNAARSYARAAASSSSYAPATARRVFEREPHAPASVFVPGLRSLLTHRDKLRVVPIRREKQESTAADSRAGRRRNREASQSVSHSRPGISPTQKKQRGRRPNQPCLPFFFFFLMACGCGSWFRGVSLSHRCASNRPVHRCLVTPRYAEVRGEGHCLFFRARFAPAVLGSWLAVAVALAAFLRSLAIIAISEPPRW
jgi:hypothetical protein